MQVHAHSNTQCNIQQEGFTWIILQQNLANLCCQLYAHQSFLLSSMMYNYDVNIEIWFLSCFCTHEMMKVLLIDNLILKLISPTFRSHPEDWSIQSKHQPDKFQDLVIYQENLHQFMHLEKPSHNYHLETCVCTQATSKFVHFHPVGLHPPTHVDISVLSLNGNSC